MKCKRCDRIGVSDVKRFTGGCQNKYGLSVDERVLGSLYFFFWTQSKCHPSLEIMFDKFVWMYKTLSSFDLYVIIEMCRVIC